MDWLKSHQNDDNPKVKEQVKILKQLRESLSRVDEKLEDKRSKLMEVDSTITDYKNQLEVLRSQMEVMKIAGIELDGATTVAQGGGTSSDLPWRDKDEDYLDLALRCMRFAHVKHYPNRSRMNYRRH